MHLKRQEKRSTAEKEQALKDLRAEVADLAVDAASKIIGRKVTVAGS